MRDRMTCGCVLALGIGLVSLVAAQAPGPDSFEPTPAERRAAQSIQDDALRAHVKFLADDLLEGRAPGSRGDRLARLYIASQFQALGLRPGAGPEDWFQPVPLVGVTTHAPDTIVPRKGDRSIELHYRDDFIATSGVARARAGFRDAELVFVGYGIVAPEYEWDDFKDADLRGKVLVVMNNDPADDPELFAGETRLFYGRWDYKYAMAARKGAAGALVIHTTASAGYPWQVVQSSWSGEQFELRDAGGPRLELRGWVTDEAAHHIAALGAHDLDALRAAAEQRDFKPVPLGVRLSVELACDVRDEASANVLGILPGSDPNLRREMVVYTAHHDHLGLAPDDGSGADRIYNGAVDNASGVAALVALARAFRELPAPPRRTVLFAAVAAEEQGLLGSEYLAAHPPVPPGYLAATINFDSLNIWGRTHDVTAIGYGKSDLDETLAAVAGWQGRAVKPDQFPDRGFFYRSDQFSFAKIGVPGLYLETGTDFVGRPAGWGRRQIEAWEAEHYHQPSDEYRADWDLSGAVEDVRLLFHAGLRVADRPEMPRWRRGDEFEAARQAALRDRR